MNAAVPHLSATPPTATFDSIRDYVRAPEARGRVLHVGAMDQDQYEVTAFAYRLIDKFGIEQAPAFMDDPEFGKNTGTYRCQVRDGKRISINPEPTQHGWRLLTSMRKRGDKVAKVAIAVGADPFTFCASSTKMAGYQEDELEFAGGLRGRALEVVKCETSDIRVPAHAEMIIEGEVPLDEGLDEGPYGEMYGYLGPMKPSNFYMNIQCITHREKPWILNSFTGLTCAMPRILGRTSHDVPAVEEIWRFFGRQLHGGRDPS